MGSVKRPLELCLSKTDPVEKTEPRLTFGAALYDQSLPRFTVVTMPDDPGVDEFKGHVEEALHLSATKFLAVRALGASRYDCFTTTRAAARRDAQKRYRCYTPKFS